MENIFKDKNEQLNLFGETKEEELKASLFDKFIVPPFSVLDARQGYWQNRKKAWKNLGIKSELGRAEHLCYNLNSFNVNEDKAIRESNGEATAPTTSIFDPVLCELAYKWFCPEHGAIIDPFAGGSVRGIVAGVLGYFYTGIDLREEQIKANEENVKDVCPEGKVFYIHGDSAEVTKTFHANTYDMAFTCPPYHNLEVYSDDPKDISNMPWEEFLSAYSDILGNTARLLKDNSFFVVVIGDVRDKKGNYRTLPAVTQRIMAENGLSLYNDIVYVTPVGSGSLRAPKQFDATRKVVYGHQYFQVYLKGDIKEAMKKLRKAVGDND